MRATNIKWDTDGDKKVLAELPSEMDIPQHLTDTDDISDWLSEQTGFCHNGFNLIKTIAV